MDSSPTEPSSNDDSVTVGLPDQDPAKEDVEEKLLRTSKKLFFAYLSLPLVVCGILTGIFQVVIFALGFGFSFNPLQFVLGLRDDSEQTQSRLISFHAFLAIGGTLLVSFQVFSTFFFHAKNGLGRKLRVGHGIVGRVVVAVWSIVVASGMAAMLLSQRWKDKVAPQVVGGIVTVVIMWNMLVGFFEVTYKNEADRDMLVHKGRMFFALVWGLLKTPGDALIFIVQLSIQDTCFLGITGEALCLAVAQTICMVSVVAGIAKYNPELLQHHFVKWNLFGLCLYAIAPWPSFFYYVEQPREEGAC